MFFLILTGHALGQSGISISKKNISIRDALYEIERQSQHAVAFDEGTLNVDQKINLSVKNKPLAEVLNIILQQTDCTFTIKNKHIIITPKEIKGDVQKRTVTGSVSDSTGRPIVGAVLTVLGQDITTVTNTEGNFKMANVPANATVRVTYVGFISRNVRIGSNEKLTITLQQEAKELEEIVVVGYATVRKKDLTTAVAVVSTEDINERPITQAAQALQGKAAGVQVVQPSGEPGGGLMVRVRGTSSFQAGNEPLYVVDGLPMNNIANLSPNDIESMQVLKDASSAAIYGARAANGVVVITTKRGKGGVRSLSLSSYAGVSRIGNTIDALNTEQYKEYLRDLKKQVPTTTLIPDDENRYTNWNDEYFGTGINQSHQLALTDGTEKLQYYISGGYMEDKGIIEKANFKRYNFRANVNNKQTDWLSLGFSIGYTRTNGRTIPHNKTAMRGGSILSVINTPPYMQKWDPFNPGAYDEFTYGSQFFSPFLASASDDTYKTSRIVGLTNLDFTIIKGLHYKVNFGIDEDSSTGENYLAPGANGESRSYNGMYSVSASKNFEWLLENLVTYDTKFNKNSLSILGGATMQKAFNEGNGGGGYDVLGPSLGLVNIINPDQSWSNKASWSLLSYLARVSYDYDGKYLLSANMRTDGSSKFAPGHKWGVFPSASAAWRISAEPFMKSTVDYLDDLKLRVGWGKTGNQGGIGNYDWMATYWASRNIPKPEDQNQTPGMNTGLSSKGYRGLTWEKTTQYNVGLDASFFNSRLNFIVDVYYKYTNDLLKTFYPPGTAGSTYNILTNMGEMSNKGLEIAINSKNVVKPKFKWNSEFNISFNKNRAENIGITPVEYYATMYSNNQPAIILKNKSRLGTFFGYRTQGIDPETGDVIYQDLDGNGRITPEDRTILGDAQPLFTGGITNTFTYSNFSVSLFFQGSYGNHIFNASKMDMTGMQDFRNQSLEVLDRWKRPGMVTDVPRPGNRENIWNSDRYIEDGSYLRLKNLSFTYDFSTKGRLSKLGIRKLQPYFTAQNLWTWTKYSGYDPEVNAYGSSALELGIDYGTYPQAKTFVLGINVEF
jgi:TonB-linked SusC/RagA family outer membrane protein